MTSQIKLTPYSVAETKLLHVAAREHTLAALKSDSDVRMIAQEAPVILARACELLTLELTLRAAKDQEHAKLITRADIVKAIKAAPTMDFLHGVVCPAQAPSQDEIAEAEEEYA